MRRPIAIAAVSLAVSAPPAAASKRTAWERVLERANAAAASPSIVVRPGHVGRSTVSVRLAARSALREPVLFSDALYGATAWHWNGRRWRRLDSAEVRPAVVKELAPGERVRVRLPLKARRPRIRVLVPVASERAGRWADVRD